MTIDPNHTTASAAANMATVGAAAHNTTTTRLVRPAVSSHLLSNLYTAPSFQIRTQWPSSSPAAANHQGVLYPLASSGRSFIHRLIRPTAAAGQPEMNPHSLWPTPELGIPRSSTPPEVAQSSVPDSNGFKDMMDKSKDDNLAIIRGRKVRMTDGASPYGWSYPPIDLRRQRRKDGTPTNEKPVRQLLQFTFQELKSVTGNFRPNNILGEGGFGYVFKWWIEENGTGPAKPGLGITVAIKSLKPDGLQGHRTWVGRE
ncbi:hypothetical protein ACFXTO_045002 [Malus domestica]